MSIKRSKWKGTVLKKDIFNQLKNSSSNSQVPIKVYSRSSIITPFCLNYSFNIFNGSKFNKITVTENMIGHKFGEFSPTRKKNTFKKK